MEFDTQVAMALYRHFARTGSAPEPADIARETESSAEAVLDAYRRLQGRRMLVLGADGATIRMAPPFSGVPTQHLVEVGGTRYYANCAWDALGIPAALQRAGTVLSRCEQSGDPLRLDVSPAGPPASDWKFHCLVPAHRWWSDIVFT